MLTQLFQPMTLLLLLIVTCCVLVLTLKGFLHNRSASGDPRARLERLNSLRTQGLVSEDEYQAKRRQLLDEI